MLWVASVKCWLEVEWGKVCDVECEVDVAWMIKEKVRVQECTHEKDS